MAIVLFGGYLDQETSAHFNPLTNVPIHEKTLLLKGALRVSRAFS